MNLLLNPYKTFHRNHVPVMSHDAGLVEVLQLALTTCCPRVAFIVSRYSCRGHQGTTVTTHIKPIRSTIEWYSVECIPPPRPSSPLSYSQMPTTYICSFLKSGSTHYSLRRWWKRQKSHNVKEREKKKSWIHPFISSSKINGVHSGLRPIIHPSFLKIQSVGFL